MSFENVDNAKEDPKIETKAGAGSTMSIVDIQLDNEGTSLDYLEEERQLALEYIQNEIATMYGDQDITDGMTVEPRETERPRFLPEETHDATESLDLANTLVYLCEFCNGMYTTELELKTHVCEHRPPNFDGNLLTEDIPSPHNETIADNNNTVNFIVDELIPVARNIPLKPKAQKLRKQLRTKRNVFKKDRIKPEANSVRSRNDKGPHVCHICDKSLSRRSSLMIHMRRHTGEMPFECDFCQKKFVVLYDLDRHMLTHVKEKKYSCFCDVCRKPFVSESGMIQHKRLRHKIYTVHSCDICGLTFSGSSKLTTHKMEHEKDCTLEILDPSNVQVILFYENPT